MERLLQSTPIGDDIDLTNADPLDHDEIDNNIQHLDIIHLFGKEKLEDIQKKLSKATGLAFVTVDYRGEPITETTMFSKFCHHMRNEPGASIRCKASDAFGAIQAAVTQKPSVYFCPCGLLEVAIPIVVRGHYLGGFIGGQVRCEDAPKDVNRLGTVIHSGNSEADINKYKHLQKEVPIYSYEKVTDIANLVFLVINQLSENEVSQHMQEELLKKRIKQVRATNRKLIKEIKTKEKQMMELTALTNPYGLLDILTSLVNLTIIEDAPRSNEVANLFLDCLKYTFMEKETLIHLSSELEQIERYFQLHQKKFGDRLAYSIQIPEYLNRQKIPPNVLTFFAQNALYYGLLLKQQGGRIEIIGYQKEGQNFLEIIDNGPGLTDEELDLKFEPYCHRHEGFYIRMGIINARAKMKNLFGEEYDVIIEHEKGKGRKYIVFWPEHFDERVGRYG